MIADNATHDSELLHRYLCDNSQQAFATLVESYHGLVLGTALRRTGDPELARDAAQHVFATLARKASLLVGRRSLAGWLYIAAVHCASRLAQSEARRRTRHLQAARETSGENVSESEAERERWSSLEAGLALLGASERESLLLHYFQDLSYPEMAASLDITEPAARKRVSRALQRLGTHLRQRGIGATATALLTGAAACQMTLPAQAGLATGALAAASGGGGSSALLTLTAIMSHTCAKTAVVIVALAVVPVLTQRSANESLRREIAAARQALPVPLPSAASSTEPNPVSAAELADLRQSVADKSDLLRVSSSVRQNAEDRVADLQQRLDRLGSEVVVSLGTVDDMAHRLGKLMSRLPQLRASQSNSVPAEKLRQMNEEISTAMGDVWAIGREAQKFEVDPSKAGRFYTAVLAEVIDFDPAIRAQCEEFLAGEFEKLRAAGLAGKPSPDDDFQNWRTKRQRFFRAMQTGLQPLMPAQPAGATVLPELLKAAFELANPPFQFEEGQSSKSPPAAGPAAIPNLPAK